MIHYQKYNLQSINQPTISQHSPTPFQFLKIITSLYLQLSSFNFTPLLNQSNNFLFLLPIIIFGLRSLIGHEKCFEKIALLFSIDLSFLLM